MRLFKKNALSVAAVQALAAGCGVAYAQTTPPTAAGDAGATIVVSGQRASMASSQQRKREAEEVVDSITAEDIGKLPDRSVTEVLQRVVGVSMDRTQARGDPIRFSAEGSGIVIRGMTYVSSQLNGRESFSANGGRSLSFEDIPPELMAGVDVYKNPSAEQIEGGIGGLVNLRTAMPFDYKGLKVSVSTKASYAQLNGKTKPEVSGLISNTWDTGLGTFGALINLTHSKSAVRTDSVFVDPFYPTTTAPDANGNRFATGKWVPKSMGWRQLDFDRTRDGAYAALQWKKDTMQSSLSYFHSKYKFYWEENQLQASIEGPYATVVSNGVYDAAGVLQSGILTKPDPGLGMNAANRYYDRTSQTDELGWNFKWSPSPRWTVGTDLQLIKSKTNGFDSSVATGVTLPRQEMDLTGSIPRLVLNAADRAYLANPSNYYWAFTMEHLDRATGEQKVAKVDAKYDFDHPVLVDLRFGLRATDREATTQNSNPFYNWQAVSQTWQVNADSWAPLGSLAYLSRFPGQTAVRPFNNFMGGRAEVSPLLMPTLAEAAGWPDSYQRLHGYAQQLCAEKHGVGADICTQAWTRVPWSAATFDPNDVSAINRQNEKTRAAFATLRFDFEDSMKLPLDGNLGVRIVQTDNTATGATVLTATAPPPGAPSSIGPVPTFTSGTTPIQADNSYTNVLPSLNLRWRATNDLQFRFAAAKAISRPDFAQLQGYTALTSDYTLSTVGSTSSITAVKLTGTASGNPMLKPVRSDQVDLTGEWYFSKVGSLTAAVFNKNLKDIIVNQTLITRVAADGGKLYDFTVTGPVNGSDGWARGFELSFQRYFDKLPGAWAGFGVMANYTRVNSKQDRHNPITSVYCTADGGDSAANLLLYANGCDTDGKSFSGLPIANLSKHTVNLALLYDRGPLSARLAYSWRSKYLQFVAPNSDNTGPNQKDGLDTNPASPNYGKANIVLGLPLWGDDYGQLDLGVSYKLMGDKLTLGLEAQNLTNSVYRNLMQQGIGLKGHTYQVSGRRYAVSARYTF